MEEKVIENNYSIEEVIDGINKWAEELVSCKKKLRSKEEVIYIIKKDDGSVEEIDTIEYIKRYNILKAKEEDLQEQLRKIKKRFRDYFFKIGGELFKLSEAKKEVRKIK